MCWWRSRVPWRQGRNLAADPQDWLSDSICSAELFQKILTNVYRGLLMCVGRAVVARVPTILSTAPSRWPKLFFFFWERHMIVKLSEAFSRRRRGLWRRLNCLKNSFSNLTMKSCCSAGVVKRLCCCWHCQWKQDPYLLSFCFVSAFHESP